MRTRIQKWGNSLALRIPKAFADEMGLEQDSPVQFRIEKGRLTIIPLGRRRISLESLLDQITEQNLHSEIDTGPSAGKETW